MQQQRHEEQDSHCRDAEKAGPDWRPGTAAATCSGSGHSQCFEAVTRHQKHHHHNCFHYKALLLRPCLCEQGFEKLLPKLSSVQQQGICKLRVQFAVV